LTITRTSSGWDLSSTSSHCRWRHDIFSWRHGGLLLYVNTTRPTNNSCVSSNYRSTWSACITQLRRHTARLSSVTEARHRTSGSARWVNCWDFITYCNI